MRKIRLDEHKACGTWTGTHFFGLSADVFLGSQALLAVGLNLQVEYPNTAILQRAR